MIAVDAHLLGVMFEAIGLQSLAAYCFAQRPGFPIRITAREAQMLREELRKSSLGIQTIEYFLSELTAAEMERADAVRPYEGGS